MRFLIKESFAHDLKARSPLSVRIGIAAARSRSLVMNGERFAGHNEAKEALLMSVAGVTAIMLIESLILLILY